MRRDGGHCAAQPLLEVVQTVLGIIDGVVEALQWPGAMFNLPIDETQISVEGSKRRAEIEMNRLKGFIKVFKGGEEPGELAADLSLIKAKVDDPDTTVAVKVRCQYRKSNDGKATYRTDFIKEVIAG